MSILTQPQTSSNGTLDFMQCMNTIIYHAAFGHIDKYPIEFIINSHMANEDYPEDYNLEFVFCDDVT